MTRSRSAGRRLVASSAALVLCVAGAATSTASAARAADPAPAAGQPAAAAAAPGPCPPAGRAISFSDALDKAEVGGVEVGGLSSLAYDQRRRAWASTVDNHEKDPARIWFFRGLTHPRLVGRPLVLRGPDGKAYDGSTADNEGLAVLPDGRFVVSSETEPSIRIFSRAGVQVAELPVPARFAVTGTAPSGQATSNATLEALTLSPDGRRLYAALEGALSGDVSKAGDARLHRILVYAKGRHGWELSRQVAYRAGQGQRIPEVAAVGRHTLVVAEASFDAATGNAVKLFEVADVTRAPDVSRIGNLSTAPASTVAPKRLLADVVRCPTLGATSKEKQRNPLLDNYEGMAVSGVRRVSPAAVRVSLSLISDDNFSDTQTTRVLNLRLRVRTRG